MDEFELVAKFYKDNTSFIEEMEEKEGQELEIAISEAKKIFSQVWTETATVW